MCHRVREAMKSDDDDRMGGIVEADETYVGARTRRGHPTWHERIKDEEEMALREPSPRKVPFDDKTAVFGVIERGSGRTHTEVVPDTRADALRPIILE